MKLIKLLIVLAATTYLFGCASGAKQENITYQSMQKAKYAQELNKNVALDTVSGGRETNPMWTSEISNQSFLGALRNSLSNQGLYSDKGRYNLQVAMVGVDKPLVGFDMTVTTRVRYTLVDTKTNQKVFEELVVAPHTATVGDAFVAVTRLRLANEGSAKKNIENFLRRLAQLKIEPQQVSLVK
ncbi:hypothetical protein [Halopseudomonas salina]|uniref:Lipoprotein n=1 Tax=Halopseudomonas salina TaxID=1323744 RepID=A0ABQ1PD02_9GAMM|nr:hypothetical protein [Halopseudomonas salina]GGC94762.1 hypothetical protein GCM10007418_12930 [Halopseudomonas salina]